MQLISLLDSKLIYFEEQSLPKEDVYRKLVAKICSFYKLPDCGTRLFNLIMKREAEATTVYPTGLAIPHIRLDGFNDTVIGICIPRKPIIDEEQEIKLIVLIITDNSSAKLYLNIVADLVRLSKNDKLFNQILSEKDSAGVFQILKHANIIIKEDLTIKDIMNTEPITINENATLKELGDVLSGNNITMIPVVSSSGHYVGEVNILQFLKVGVPDYLMMMNNLNFLRSYEPFENLFQQEDKVRVKDIMSRQELTLSPDSSIIEAVFKMIQSQKRFFTVTQDKKVTGIITAMDIFRKVVRA
jgi:PTS system nitrogen regulatory IIA component